MLTYPIGNLHVNDLRRWLPRHASKAPPARTMDELVGVCIHNVGPPVHREFTSAELAGYHISHHDWPRIAYSFVVHMDGAIDYTLDWPEVGYHAGGRNNYEYLGVCVTGWFDDERVPTSAQLAATRELIANLSYAFGRQLTVKAHKEIALPGYATACPGATWEQWKGALVAPSPAAPVSPTGETTVQSELEQLRAEVVSLRARLNQIADLARL